MAYPVFQQTLGALSSLGNTLTGLSELDTRRKAIANENALRNAEFGLKKIQVENQGKIGLLQTQSEINQRNIENARAVEQLGFVKNREEREAQEFKTKKAEEDWLNTNDIGYNLMVKSAMRNGITTEEEAKKSTDAMITPLKTDTPFERERKMLMRSLLMESTTPFRINKAIDRLTELAYQKTSAIEQERIRQEGITGRIGIGTPSKEYNYYANVYDGVNKGAVDLAPDSPTMINLIQEAKRQGIETAYSQKDVYVDTHTVDDMGEKIYKTEKRWQYTPVPTSNTLSQSGAGNMQIDPQKKVFIDSVRQSIPDFDTKTPQEQTDILNNAFKQQKRPPWENPEEQTQTPPTTKAKPLTTPKPSMNLQKFNEGGGSAATIPLGVLKDVLSTSISAVLNGMNQTNRSSATVNPLRAIR
jgi:hypothetical protein